MLRQLSLIYTLLVATTFVMAALHTLLRLNRMRRISHTYKRLSRCYIRIATTLIVEDVVWSRFPTIELKASKQVLARILADISAATYGTDVAILWSIATENGIDQLLLRKVRRSRGYERAYYISLLASLPLPSGFAARIEPYASDPNPIVRFYSLLIRIRCDSSSALRELANYDHPLTRFELGELIALLRRGLLPVACEPLLTSPNHNLRIVGLNIVREFGVEEATPLLLRIATCDPDTEIAREALYTMVAMRSALTHKEIAKRVASLPNDERHTLCRKLAKAGYSTSTLKRLFTAAEAEYAENLTATYKRTLVCQQIY